LQCGQCSVGTYLHDVTENLGLDYKFDGTTINVSRFVTRTFVLAAIPGKVSIKSDLTKGTDTTTGTQGGGATAGSGNASTGSFSAVTQSVRSGGSGEFDYMQSIKNELIDLKSPPGKVEVNPQTRLVFVYDTKENVDRMTDLLKRENGLALRQVAIRVRTIQLALTGNTQAGVSADVVFNRIQDGLTKWSVTTMAPTSLATAAGGTIGLSILKPNAPLTGTNSVLQALNTFGKTIEDDSVTKVTLDGVPVPVASYETKGYLAATTPSFGSIAGSTAGVPGLTPGSVTVGKFINLLPSVEDNNRIILSYWSDSSQLNGPFTTISTGSGATQQQIQLPDVTGKKDEQHISLADGQTVVLYGEVDNHYDSTSNGGIAGASAARNKQRTFQIVMLTATVVPSM
jgi:type IVB pilus formation R64 PilN family outer membrane protein